MGRRCTTSPPPRRQKRGKNHLAKLKGQDPTISVFFANITFASKAAIDYVNELKGYHIVGLAETHARGLKAAQAANRARKTGWVPLHADAAQSQTSASGTNGGMMRCHPPWLTIGTPVEAEGLRGETMPDPNFIWKLLRVKGLSIAVGFVYFPTGNSLTQNMYHVLSIRALQDRGYQHIIIAGDVNVPVEDWYSSGLLEGFGMRVVVPGDGLTCRTP